MGRLAQQLYCTGRPTLLHDSLSQEAWHRGTAADERVATVVVGRERQLFFIGGAHEAAAGALCGAVAGAAAA